MGHTIQPRNPPPPERAISKLRPENSLRSAKQYWMRPWKNFVNQVVWIISRKITLPTATNPTTIATTASAVSSPLTLAPPAATGAERGAGAAGAAGRGATGAAAAREGAGAAGAAGAA